jgi:hypothetical protein
MSNIDDITKHINELLGDPEPDLKGAVSDFDGSWDDNRKEIVESTEKMSKGTDGVITSWTQWDTDKAKQLNSDNVAKAPDGKPDKGDY